MVNMLKTWWARLSPLPFGKWFFSKVIGFLIPYTGTASPRVEEIRPGFAKVIISDRRRIRNHLNSIHALAIANLGELTTGLALHFAMEPDKRAILTGLNIEYLKKAREKITATATLDLATAPMEGPTVVEAHMVDLQGQVVARVKANWLVSKTTKV